MAAAILKGMGVTRMPITNEKPQHYLIYLHKATSAQAVFSARKTNKTNDVKGEIKMKHLKKLLALALVAMTVLAVAVPAMAATDMYVNTTPNVNFR